jgi:hypothetical protein
VRAGVASSAALVILSVAPPPALATPGDLDHDGLSNRYEVKRSHTKPHRWDTDGDKLSDGFEIRRAHTDPRLKDTDGDGLTDGSEVRRFGTSPRRKDTDRDGTSDGIELLSGTDPLTRGKKKGQVLAPPDSTSPDTTITAGPSGVMSTSEATFEFSSSEAGSSFECRLDSAAWAKCSSPTMYSGLADASHTFDARATDAAGNTDASPATRTWTVVATASAEPPTASFTWSPQNPQSPPVSVAFTSTGTCAATPCTYLWRQGPPGNEPIGTGQTSSWAYDSIGTKTVVLRVTDVLGRFAEGTNSFAVSAAPAPLPPLCNNGRDDDGDGKVDYPADPGCTDAQDDSESPDPPPPPPTPPGLPLSKRVCMNTHMFYTDTTYQDIAQVKAELDYMGVDCIRDGLPPDQVAATATKFVSLDVDVIAYCGGSFSNWWWEGREATCVNELDSRVPRAVAVEGMNEPYCHDQSGLDANTSRLLAHMTRIRDAALQRGLVPYSVSLCDTDTWHGSLVPGIVNAIHPYHSQGFPEIGPASIAHSMDWWIQNRGILSDSGRFAATEFGSHPDWAAGNETVRARYNVVTLLNALKRGQERAALYQAQDEGTSTGWGFYTSTHVAKPSAEAFHRLLGLVGAASVDAPSGFTYTVSDPANAVLDLSLRDGAGNNYVALWNRQSTNSRTVTLNLSAANPVQILRPVTSAALEDRAESAAHALQLGDDPVMVKIAP